MVDDVLNSSSTSTTATTTSATSANSFRIAAARTGIDDERMKEEEEEEEGTTTMVLEDNRGTNNNDYSMIVELGGSTSVSNTLKTTASDIMVASSSSTNLSEEFEEAPSFDELMANTKPSTANWNNNNNNNNDNNNSDEINNDINNTGVSLIANNGTNSDDTTMWIDTAATGEERATPQPDTTTATSRDSSSSSSQVGYATAETLVQIEMLRSENLMDRAQAMSQLDTIGRALGTERCQRELLPFLSELADADEDDVLLAMAEHIPKLVSVLSNTPQPHVLFVPLEKLLMVEENSVREKAISSCLQIYSQLLQSQHDSSSTTYYADMILRLATKEWFTARMSACTLIAADFTSLTLMDDTTTPNEVLELFAKLCHDEVPVVRRIASQNLGMVVEKALPIYGSFMEGILSQRLLPIYEEIPTNDQDSIRICTADNCISLGKAMMDSNSSSKTSSPQQNEQLLQRIIPILIASANDRSWRVRWKTASKFNEVAQVFSSIIIPNTTTTDYNNNNKSYIPSVVAKLFCAYEGLLQDTESEVRTAATFNLGEVARSIINTTNNTNSNNPDGTALTMEQLYDTNNMDDDTDDTTATTNILMSLVKKVPILADDEAEHVRAALALVITELSPTLGMKLSVQQLLPPISLLLRDSSAEVRLNMISSLGPLKQIFGSLELLHPVLLPAITELASPEGEQASKWRIRLSIIAHMPLLAEQLGQSFFNEKLTSLCVSWLADDISSIRDAAATNVMNLAAVFGPAWAFDFIYPPLLELKCHPSYLRRLSAVQAASLLATKVEPDTPLMRNIVPMILDMASDSVPNVRFNVARALFRIAEPCGVNMYKQQIRPVISVLTEDPDRDVRFFAEKSLKDADQQLGTVIVMT